jgi:hypothetical protein
VSGAAAASDRVEFIDEDDRRGGLARLLEQAAHAACAHPHEHLDELAGVDAEERDSRFSGDRAGEQRLAGAGRADHQNSLRDGRADIVVFLRMLQEIDFLHQVGLGFIGAGDVIESDARFLAAVAAHLGLAQPEQARLGAPRARHQPPENPEYENQRQPFDERLDEPWGGGWRDIDLDVFRLKQRQQLRIADRGGKGGVKFGVPDGRRRLSALGLR